MDEGFAKELGAAIARLNSAVAQVAAKEYPAPAFPPATPVNLVVPASCRD